jgi:LysR family nitrogen assimilation transcriptional regulator
MHGHESTSPVIDLRQLHYFLALANYGSISAAASVLGLAQPSVSENITKLEKKLNVQLAIRGPRGVTLTEAGLTLASQGRDLIDAAQHLAENVCQIASEVRGPVSIGLPPSLSLLLSVPLAETVYSELPNVRLHLAEGMSGHVLEWVESEKLDMGCVYESPDSTIFESHPILVEELFIVSAPDNLPIGCSDTGQLSVTVSALGDLPFVMPSLPHGARRIVERFARANRIHVNVVTEMDSLPHIVEMVNRASAYTILPQAAVARAVDAGQLVLIKIAEPTFTRTAYLTRKRSRPASAASLSVQRTMIKIIKEVIERYKLEASLTSYALAELGTANN